MSQAVTQSTTAVSSIMGNPIVVLVPFLLLLLAIATIPMLHRQWWHRAYPYIVLLLSTAAIYYQSGVLHDAAPIFHSLQEYGSFIILIGALYVVSGGIRIDITGSSTPWGNVILLLAGALLSNIIGTMGASILLIRPYLRYNRGDFHGYHLAFFIFLVSNMGGLLTPIGDPPLFLGYLEGVPAGWLFRNMVGIWAFTVGSTLFVFYQLERRRWNRSGKSAEVTRNRPEIRLDGLINLIPLAIIVGSLFVTKPLYLREGIIFLSAIASMKITNKKIYEQNEFNFLPLKELSILFIGIFITLGPVMALLESHTTIFSLSTPGQLFWATGFSSSVLDNAPTYLAYFGLARGFLTDQTFLHQFRLLVSSGAGTMGAGSVEMQNTVNYLSAHQVQLTDASDRSIQIANIIANHPIILQAVSAGSVLFGALTYIGNGPNFVIKSVAEHSGLKTPSFFRYIWCYAVPVLIPVFVIVWLVWMI